MNGQTKVVKFPSETLIIDPVANIKSWKFL